MKLRNLIWNFCHLIRYFKARKKEKQLARLMATPQGRLKIATELVKPLRCVFDYKGFGRRWLQDLKRRK